MVREEDNAGSGDPDYVQWLLDAIAKVKGQKQRPNLERITGAVRLYHKDVTQSLVSEQLALAVKSGAIIKVYNKGICTYTDPAKVSHSRYKTLQIHKNVDLTKAICRSIKNAKLSSGCDVKAIENFIRGHYTVESLDSCKLTHCLRASLKRGVNTGQFVRNGQLYKVGSGCSESESVESNGSFMHGNASSEEDLVPIDLAADKNSKKVAKPILICSFCLGTKQKNRDGVPEELISCADCGNSGHPSCLRFAPSLTERVRHLRWQCIECKTCSLCGESGKEDNMLFCDACDRGFHMECCKPPITRPPKGTWICCLCDRAGLFKRGLITDMSELPSPQQDPKKVQPNTANGPDRPKKKKYEPERCPTPGCDGSGNVNGKNSHHRKAHACPLLPPDKRPKKPKKKKVPTATLR